MQDDRLVERSVVVVVMLVTLNFWLLRHRGTGLDGVASVSGGVALVTGAFGLLSLLQSINQQNASLKKLRSGLVWLLSYRNLAWAGLMLMTLLLTTSSVVVLNDFGDQDNLPVVSLTAVDGGSLKVIRELPREKDGAFRFFLFTTPFGRPFRLKVDGYLPKNVEAFPVWGITLSARYDLRPAPTLLLRPVQLALRNLEDGGEIIVTRVSPKPEVRLAQDKGHRSAFLLGEPRVIPAVMLENWRLELVAEGENEQGQARTLLEWKRPTPLEMQHVKDLEPGMVLRVQVFARSGVLVAETYYEVGEQEFTDVSVLALITKPPAATTPGN